MLKYQQLLQQAADSVDYWSHIAMRGFVRDLGQRMEDRGMKRADLARKIEASTAYVTKVMRGDANFTLETMTKLAMAVGGKLDVRIAERDAASTFQRRGHDGWQIERKDRQEIASASAVLRLDASQIAANQEYGNKLHLSRERRVA